MPRVRQPREPLTPHALLQVIWLASPALPVVGFSYSEVLEAAVGGGQVSDESSVRTWLLDQRNSHSRAATCLLRPPRSSRGAALIWRAYRAR
jgi:urease accessory protein UreF